MKAEYKYSWMVWAIIILAIMNLSTIITVVYLREKSGKEEIVAESNQVLNDNSSIRYSGRYFRDNMSLSNEQMALFQKFNPGFRQNVMTINMELNRKRKEMLMEMTLDNCDTVKLNILSDSIGYLHANLKKVTFRYYLELKKICNQQQQEKLEQIFSEMFATDAQMGQPGKGRSQYRYRGGRSDN